MAGTVVMIVVLVLFIVPVAIGGAVLAALIGTALQRDRDEAYAGSEHLAMSRAPAGDRAGHGQAAGDAATS